MRIIELTKLPAGKTHVKVSVLTPNIPRSRWPVDVDEEMGTQGVYDIVTRFDQRSYYPVMHFLDAINCYHMELWIKGLSEFRE